MIDLDTFVNDKVTFREAKDSRVIIFIDGRSEGYICKRKAGISWIRKGKTMRLFTQEVFVKEIQKIIDGEEVVEKEEKEEKVISGLAGLFDDESEKIKKEEDEEQKTNIKTQFVETSNEIKKMEFAINNMKNVLLKGPSGCGKSFLIDELAKHYGKKVHVVNCDVELDKSELIGHHLIIDGEKGPVSIWIPGLIPVAMEKGDWIVFDELNMSKSQVLSSLNQALDHRRRITIKENENEVIKAHPDFRAFACINPGYAGTCDINFALRRRFGNIIDMKYLPEAREVKLVMKRTGLDLERAEKIVRIANDTRDLQKQGKIEQSVSTAHLIEFAEMLKTNKFTPIECAEITLNLTDDDAEQEDILNVVKHYF